MHKYPLSSSLICCLIEEIDFMKKKDTFTISSVYLDDIVTGIYNKIDFFCKISNLYVQQSIGSARMNDAEKMST